MLRPARLFAALAVALCSTTGVTAAVSDKWFQEGNFFKWYYVNDGSPSFSSIRSGLQAVRDQGYRCIFIYCPFDGNPARWLGCSPMDLMVAEPAAGGLAQWDSLVATAHNLGIAVGMYHTLIYIDPSSPIWTEAQNAMRAGDTANQYVGLFKWGTQPMSGGYYTTSAYSSIAGKYYGVVWESPAIDWGSARALAYLEKVQRFWCEHGVDGFEYDAPWTTFNLTDAALTKICFQVPSSTNSRRKMTIAEGIAGAWGETVRNLNLGYTHITLDDDQDDWNCVAAVINGEWTVAQMEARMAYRDIAANRGGGAWEIANIRTSTNQQKSMLELASLAGNGVFIEVKSTDTQLSSLMNAINNHAAQQPGGARKRLSTGASTTAHAVLRSSMDGRSVGMNIYNFSAAQATVTVDLTGNGITVPQTPFDIYGKKDGPAISGNSFQVTLPAWGFLMLDVKGAGTPLKLKLPPEHGGFGPALRGPGVIAVDATGRLVPEAVRSSRDLPVSITVVSPPASGARAVLRPQ